MLMTPAKAESDPRPRQQIRRRPIERDVKLMRRAGGADREGSERGDRIVSRERNQR
jgi:hypothetical protein